MLNPVKTSEKIIDAASWVGVGACGAIIAVGTIGSLAYAFGLVPKGIIGMAYILLGAFGTLFIAVGVATVTGFVSRLRGTHTGE